MGGEGGHGHGPCITTWGEKQAAGEGGMGRALCAVCSLAQVQDSTVRRGPEMCEAHVGAGNTRA